MALSANIKESFLTLIRLGLDLSESQTMGDVDWPSIRAVAAHHGLSGVALDGMEKLPDRQRASKQDLLKWIGEVLQIENVQAAQWKAACKMADVFDMNDIRTYILKGAVIAECYPKPAHRVSTDIDCFLLPQKDGFDAWSLGNDLMRCQGCEVDEDYYKHSDFNFQGVRVENHRFMTPCRGNKWLTKMESFIQGMLRGDTGEDKMGSSNLCRPPRMVSALFIIEHSYSHFMGEGLIWKHVTDWLLFEKKHKNEIDWNTFLSLLEEFGLKKFYDSFSMICRFLAGDVSEEMMSKRDKLMLDDIWADSRIMESGHTFRGKLRLGLKTICSAWKYHYFAVMSMPHALWIYIKGYLFKNIPTV